MNGKIDENEVIVDDTDTESIDGYANGAIYPYDMPTELDIREDPLTVFEWLRKLRRGDLILDPEFQRNLVWKPFQKSQFIESVLLNIPLPPLYVNQNVKGKYIIVDGLQRTSTLQEFVENRFKLHDLRILIKLNNLEFSCLSQELQTKIEDKKLLVYIIKPTVPLNMVYDIFHRINTGGTQLTYQEIRNSFYLGPATRLLKELAEADYFQQAIDNGISPTRMKDREAVLRYLAFKVLNYKIDYKGDMNSFLGQVLRLINQMAPAQLVPLKQDFERVMRLTFEFFGKNNFRWPLALSRGRINLALMESVSYFFSLQSDEFLKANRSRILSNYQKLLQNERFKNAVRFSTSDTKHVITRFEVAQEVLGDVI